MGQTWISLRRFSSYGGNDRIASRKGKARGLGFQNGGSHPGGGVQGFFSGRSDSRSAQGSDSASAGTARVVEAPGDASRATRADSSALVRTASKKATRRESAECSRIIRAAFSARCGLARQRGTA